MGHGAHNKCTTNLIIKPIWGAGTAVLQLHMYCVTDNNKFTRYRLLEYSSTMKHSILYRHTVLSIINVLLLLLSDLALTTSDTARRRYYR